jgi:hypothetical protein
MIVFVSYSSTSRDAVETLVVELGELGLDVEYEIKFVGAPITWRHVFTSIAHCDLFISAVSRETLISSTCEIEYQYARSLHKNILAVLLEDLSTEELPDMKVKGLIDFRVNTPFAQAQLAEAINSLLAPMLPSPSDEAIPSANWVTPLAELRTRIENLPRDAREQRAVILNVKEFLERRESFEVASSLLDLLAVQPGLRQLTTNQIHYIRGELKQIRAATRGARRRRTLVGAIVLSSVVALVAVVASQLFFRFRTNYNVELSLTRTAETMAASDIASSASTTLAVSTATMLPTLEFSSTPTYSQPSTVSEVASPAPPVSLATNTPFILASTATPAPPTAADLPSSVPSMTAIPLTLASVMIVASSTAPPPAAAATVTLSPTPTQTLPAVTVVASTQAASANGQRVNVANWLPQTACIELTDNGGTNDFIFISSAKWRWLYRSIT